ncbi:SEL1-like repeat protein [Ralstonia mannitolilytica]|uniref:hypothetical protein n=1 Tax=Ralstonia mannitolilytica TaxID=105219 RepID=UPI00292DAA46|nr:hypothetical protein [Ralstonia mannitolilytica]
MDDAYCLRVAYGTVPMPPIPVTATSTTSNVTGQVRIHDSSTGNTSFGSYSGAVTTSPANSFASGFANGMAIGAAFRAQKLQDQIHAECMIRKGWREASFRASHAAPSPVAQVTQPPQATSGGDSTPPGEASYDDGKTAWLAEVNEFTVVYPQYRASRELWDRLDAAVKKLARERPLATGPQILLAAHDGLNLKGLGAPEPLQGDSRWLLVDTYRQAVGGSVADQNALGAGFMFGKPPFIRDLQRSKYWFQKSAMAGDPMGQMGYGTLIFEGATGTPNRARGYWWVMKAAAAGDKDAINMLTVMEAKMDPSELQAARSMR